MTIFDEENVPYSTSNHSIKLGLKGKRERQGDCNTQVSTKRIKQPETHPSPIRNSSSSQNSDLDDLTDDEGVGEAPRSTSMDREARTLQGGQVVPITLNNQEEVVREDHHQQVTGSINETRETVKDQNQQVPDALNNMQEAGAQGASQVPDNSAFQAAPSVYTSQ